MITLKNPLAASEWIIDLKEYSQVENSLPMTGLNVRNDSNIVAYVDLNGFKVGEVQRYSADPFQGRNYSLIRIYNPDGQNFAPDDLFIQATKGEQMSSQPFNPQWDMMFDDLTRFATGTDTRLSLSATITLFMVKYLINLNGGTIVLRRLDIQAHATLLGQIAITFDSDNTLNTATGIGTPPPSDATQHKALITGGSFDYSETNAEIIGLMIDYLNKTGDISDGYTIIVGGASGVNAYDDDLSNPTDAYYKSAAAGAHTLWEVSFSERTLSEYHVYHRQKRTSSGNIYTYLDAKINGVWTEIKAVLSTQGTTYSTITTHEFNRNDLKVTGIRLRIGTTTSYGGYAQIYDISVF